MRAAMTYAFGRLHGLGDMPWHRSEVTNEMLGNPSVSTLVSSYMCALRRRKVRLSPSPPLRSMSHDLLSSATWTGRYKWARSLSALEPSPRSAVSHKLSILMLVCVCMVLQELLYKLYHYNHQPSNWDIRPYVPSVAAAQLPTATATSTSTASNHPRGIVEATADLGQLESSSLLHNWGGGRVRVLLQAVYTIAHLCLLRSDEVLKIQVHDMTLYENGVSILLPFRKTHQSGGRLCQVC